MPSIKKSISELKRKPFLSLLFGVGVGIIVNFIADFLLKSKTISIILIILLVFGTIL